MDIKEDLHDPKIFDDEWEADPAEIELPEEKPTVQESIQETLQTLDLFMNNKFQEALDLMEPWAHCSSYHALGKSTVCFIQTILSFDPDDITRTMEVLKESVAVCNRLRRKGTLVYITRLLRGVDYNMYTTEEVHAELCYAECLLLTALLTFVSDNSFVNFIKGGLRIRACYRAYKEAALILENRRWEDEEDRRHYESGVRMGLGIFYLVVAHLPTRIIRVLEMIGFCGDKETGLQYMYDSVALDGSLRSPLTALFLLCYNTIITYLFGLADGDLVSSEYIVKNMLKKYPRGALYLFLYGRLLEVKGEFDQLIVFLNYRVHVRTDRQTERRTMPDAITATEPAEWTWDKTDIDGAAPLLRPCGPFSQFGWLPVEKEIPLPPRRSQGRTQNSRPPNNFIKQLIMNTEDNHLRKQSETADNTL
ncbi:Tetratricopeptide repeat protein 39B [Araneus ventricosus]|uniref:Tetratricopeptide repeat protein 39B n=1 Tax=Araneus ventricosus TaxID=182803 RepID=A0A4Y2DV03_ARAVE|nr:Tetratricopeptide repeat protein 39B [Araneus ventricosus]